MPDKIDFDKLSTRKVKISVETASLLLKKCKKKVLEVVEKSSNIYTDLSELIMEQFSGDTPDSQYLRNLDGDINKQLDPLHPEKEMTIFFNRIFVLATIAGITDIDGLIEKKHLQPLSFPVFYTPKPWKMLQFIRVPQNGTLNQNLSNWEYHDFDGHTLTGNVISATPFTMPGDRHAYWIKVDHNNPSGSTTSSYFADCRGEAIIPVSQSEWALSFFKKLEQLNIKKQTV